MVFRGVSFRFAVSFWVLCRLEKTELWKSGNPKDGAGRVRLAGGYTGAVHHGGTDRSNDTTTSTPSPTTVSLATVLEAFAVAIHHIGVRNLGALKLDVETVTRIKNEYFTSTDPHKTFQNSHVDITLVVYLSGDGC